ncbi:MAG: epoxyqueuosine reductase QueH [Treponema sp.]|nr:epoxyqueuosine reductase QueH [Treponema sp.]
MKLLLHCCCAPCSIACIEHLAAEAIAPMLFWYNPNIHPFTEYQSRRDALRAFVSAKNLPLECIDEYGLLSFLEQIGNTTAFPDRCDVCYRMRLEQTAAFAAKHGFDAFSTTLLISPYQQHDTIRRLGEALAAQYGIAFVYRDFRPLFREGQNQARALGLYMQKYCGCMLSEREKGKEKREKSDVIDPFFQRLTLITGAEALERLRQTRVLIFGVGGVGSWCAEALVRSGVGKIGIVDFDTVCASNVNRQVQATSRTLGHSKVAVLQKRLREINPHCEVTTWETLFSRENAVTDADDSGICRSIAQADYVIDAIDTFPHKLDLIETCCAASPCKQGGVKLFSSMGMAKKMDPTRIRIAGIWETRGCSLARLVRQGLRQRGFSGDFTVVYSDEQLDQHNDCDAAPNGKKINGSAVTVTASAGMALASLVLRDVALERQ